MEKKSNTPEGDFRGIEIQEEYIIRIECTLH